MWKESSSISRPQVFLQQLAGEQRRLLQTVVGSLMEGRHAADGVVRTVRHSNREGHGGRQLEKWVSGSSKSPRDIYCLRAFALAGC